MITRKIIDNFHADIEQYYNDYLDNKKQYGMTDSENEWYQQLEAIIIAAYGDASVLNS